MKALLFVLSFVTTLHGAMAFTDDKDKKDKANEPNANAVATEQFLTAVKDALKKVGGTNGLRDKADEALKAGSFDDAIHAYSYIIDSLQLKEEPLLLNLGHAYFENGNYELAFGRYSDLGLAADNKEVKSVALQQLGVIAHGNDGDATLLGLIRRSLGDESPALRKRYAPIAKQFEKEIVALQAFRKSLMANPANQEARYNYELLYKFLEEQLNNPQNQEKDDQEKEDQEQEQNDQEQDEQEEQEQQEQEGQDGEQKEQQEQEGKDGEEKEQQEQEGQEGEEGEQKEQQQQEGQEGEEGDPEEQQPQPEEGQEGEEEGEPQPQPNGEEGEPDEAQEPQPMPKSQQEKLEEMNISEETALMILNASRNNEIQYIQQNKRKPTKRKDRTKPDW